MARLRWRLTFVSTYGDLLLIRTLRPLSGNVGKRLVKTPKVYIRDNGLTYTLLDLTSLDDLSGHPVVGVSWEGFVLENLLSCLSTSVIAWLYRTSAGAEIDPIIKRNRQQLYAIGIKRSLVPSLSRGFCIGCEDIGATKRFLVYPGIERYPIALSQRLERKHLTLPTCLKRLTRYMICFSKLVVVHDTLIGLY